MIKTGLLKIDNFLSGGIPNGLIVDIFGGSGTGKTQLLLQLSINSIKNNGNVLYLDTTGGFRPERILEIQKNLTSILIYLIRLRYHELQIHLNKLIQLKISMQIIFL